MCPVGLPVLVLVLGVLTAAAATKEEDDGIKRCLETNRLGGCLEDLASDLLERAVVPDRLSLAPGLELVRNDPAARGMADISNRTISMDLLQVAEGIAKGADPRGHKKRRRIIIALVAIALLAAKAASVATATAILVPLALKGITLLAVKALVIGKIAVVVASAFGFLRLISSSTEHTTEVIYDHKASHHKRVDRPMLTQGFNLVRKDHVGKPFFASSNSGPHHFSSSGPHHLSSSGQHHLSSSGQHHLSSGGQHHLSSSSHHYSNSEPQNFISGSPSEEEELGVEEQVSHVYRFPPPSTQTLPPPIAVRRPNSKRR